MKRSPLRRGKYKPKRTPEQAEAYAHARQTAASRSYGTCQAHDMHAQGCPGIGSHAHHIRTQAKGGSDHPDNLLWVHPDCHARIHSHPNDAKKAGYLI